MTFNVLFVCTGNICRSPIAERLFVARIDPSLPITAASAGTHGLTGWEMDATSARALREVGGDPDGHSAQRLESDLIAAAGLILTAETEHALAVVQMDPDAKARTFTMREFAMFGAGADKAPAKTIDELRARVAFVDSVRAEAPRLPGMLTEIGDPFGARLNFARHVARMISAAVDGIIVALGAQRHEQSA